MGEQTVDQIVKRLKGLKGSNGEAARCRTAQEPLLPVAETSGVSGILPPEFSRRPVEHYVAREWAVHLDDVMVRRTSWHYYFRDAASKAQQVADWMGELLGWSAETRKRGAGAVCPDDGQAKGSFPCPKRLRQSLPRCQHWRPN